MKRLWRRWFPGRWSEAEILWLYVKAHHRWVTISPLTDPLTEEYLAHDQSTCWKCQAWKAFETGQLI